MPTEGLAAATAAEAAELKLALRAVACPCEDGLGAWREARRREAREWVVAVRFWRMLALTGWLGVCLGAALALLR